MQNAFRSSLLAVALLIFAAGTAVAEDAQTAAPEPQQITFRVNAIGINGATEFSALTNSVKRIQGVYELVPAKLARGAQSLDGRFTGDPEMLINDLAAATMDRYKLEKKQSKTHIDFRLSKM